MTTCSYPRPAALFDELVDALKEVGADSVGLADPATVTVSVDEATTEEIDKIWEDALSIVVGRESYLENKRARFNVSEISYGPLEPREGTRIKQSQVFYYGVPVPGLFRSQFEVGKRAANLLEDMRVHIAGLSNHQRLEWFNATRKAILERRHDLEGL